MNDKLKKYTHKEINVAAMEARKAAEIEYTLEAIREKNPRNTTLKTEASLGMILYHRYNEYEIETLIQFLQTEKARGATHFNVEFYDDDSELTINTSKMLAESPQEWMDRVITSRDKLLDSVYGKKQREMLDHNKKIETYLQLKRELND